MCKVIIDVLIIYILIIYYTKIEIKAKPDKKTRDFNTTSNNSNYSAIMNVEYQELINVTLWQKGSK